MRDNTAARNDARFPSALQLWIVIWQQQIVNARA
jgi:hypothetical protein